MKKECIKMLNDIMYERFVSFDIGLDVAKCRF